MSASLNSIENYQYLTKLHNAYLNDIKSYNTNKEISITSAKLFDINHKLLRFNIQAPIDLQSCDKFAEKSQHYAKLALENGLDCQSEYWQENLKFNSEKAFYEYYDVLVNYYGYDDRIKRLVKLLNVSFTDVKACIYFRICDCHYKYAFTLINNCDYQYAQLKIDDFKRYLNEAIESSIGYVDILNLLYEMKYDFTRQLPIIKSKSYKRTAQKLLKEYFYQSDQPNYQVIFDMLQWYGKALKESIGHEVETEAEVRSDLGFVYEKLLKNKELAKEYYQTSWHLANSCRPMSFIRSEWYQRCVEAIKRHQQEVIKNEEYELEKRKKEILNEIHWDLVMIKLKSDKKPFEFLKFLYENYPPKKFSCQNLNEFDVKRALEEAIINYSPNDIYEDDRWYFICREVSKYLTCFYDYFKVIE